MVRAFAVETENRIASLALGGIMLIPLVEIASRKFFTTAIPGAGAYAATLTLWLGCWGRRSRRASKLSPSPSEFCRRGASAPSRTCSPATAP